ncbi:hypothetical protein, partial [Amycolatopsis speibonae]
VLHEGEWNKYDDLLLLLQAKKDWLPVNISLVPGRARYSDPLVRWTEVWLRAYQEAELRKTGNAPAVKHLIPLVGGIVGSSTVYNWSSGFPKSVEQLSHGDAPPGSVLAGPPGGSGVGASLEATGPQMLQPGLLSSGLGVGGGVLGFAGGGVPVVSGGGGWLVGSGLPERVEMEGLARELQEEMSQRPGREEQIQPAPVGVLIGGVGSLLRDAAALLLKEAGVHGVVLLDEGARDLGVIERAVLDSGWGGEPVRLFACETGDGALDRLAGGLQERLGVAVGYPIELLWLEVEEDGPAARVGKLGLTEDSVPVLVLRDVAGGGGWVWRVRPDRQHPDGRIEGWPYTVPAPEGGLGLGRPRHLAPGDTDPVSSGSGAEGQGVAGAGASEAFLEAVRAGEVPWGAGPGRDGSLKAYLRDTGHSGEVTPEVLQDWVRALQDASVRVTGMRVPVPLVAALSGKQLNAKQAQYRTGKNPILEPSLEQVRKLMPKWFMEFRPSEGEWEQYGDLLSFLKANGHRLPVNIWLEHGGERYSEPLRRWTEVWMRAYYKEKKAQGLGADLTAERLASLSGHIVYHETVSSWNLGFSESVADRSLDKSSSGEGEGSGQPPGIPEYVHVDVKSWRPGPGRGDSLRAYLEATGRLNEATTTALRKWLTGIQQDAVTETGMRVPAHVVVALSDGLIDAKKAIHLTTRWAPRELKPDEVASLVPPWVMAFRPGEGEGQFPDLLPFLRANKDRLPVNIWLEPDENGNYSDPLLRWTEVWKRAYEAELGETGTAVRPLAGGIEHPRTVRDRNLGFPQSFAEHSVGNAPSGSAFPGPFGGSGVGASTTSQGKRPRLEAPEASGSQLLEMPGGAGWRSGVEHELLRVPGSGFGVGDGALGYSAAGVPVPFVPGAGGGGWRPVGLELQHSGGWFGGGYVVPVPLAASDGGLGLGLDQSWYLTPGGTDLVSFDPGAEGQGVTGAGSSDALPAEVPAGEAPWGAGPGQNGSLDAYLKETRSSNEAGPATQEELRKWVGALQDAAVAETGRRIPAAEVAALSGGQINKNQVRGHTGRNASSALKLGEVPDWFMDFRPDEEVWHGGELRKFPDLLSFLQAKKDDLPVNISLEPDARNRYSYSLLRWTEVWMRAYYEEKAQEPGANLTAPRLAELTGGIARPRTVRDWKLGSSESVADLSVGNASSGSALPGRSGRSGGSGAGASTKPQRKRRRLEAPEVTEAPGSQMLQPGSLPSGLEMPGSGFGAGAPGYSAAGVPVPFVPGAGGGGWWPVGSELQHSGGRFEGTYTVPAPLAPGGVLGLAQPQLVPAVVKPWGAGPGQNASLEAYLKVPGRSSEATPVDWVRALQAAAVAVTGLRVPALLVAALSNGRISKDRARELTRWNAPSALKLGEVALLVPDWFMDFRPDEEVWHGGELRKFPDLLSFLQAKKDDLPVIISLEPDARNRYSYPLLRWTEVWMRAYYEEKAQEPGAKLTAERLAGLTGGIAGVTTVRDWKLGSSQSVVQHSVGNASSGSALPGRSGRSGRSGGSGAGAPGFSTAGVPVVSGAGGGGGWLVGSVQPEQVGLQGLSQVEMEGFSREFRVEMSERLWREEARIQPAPVGVIIGEVGSVLGGAAWWLPKEDGVHGVVLLDEEARHLDAIERALRSSGWREGEAIRLFGCETGDGVLWRLALDLWVRFGVDVWYPVGLLWLGVRGPGPGARVGSLDWTGDGVPELVLFEGGGGWARRVGSPQEQGGGLIEGSYTVPGSVGGLGLDGPRHLAPGGADPVAVDPGTESQGVPGVGSSEALPAGGSAGVKRWGAGPGEDGSLEAYLKKTRSSDEASPSSATQTELQDWVRDLQAAAVTVTGMRVPA